MKICVKIMLVITILFLYLENRKRENYIDIADIVLGIKKKYTDTKDKVKKVMDKIPPNTPIDNPPEE